MSTMTTIKTRINTKSTMINIGRRIQAYFMHILSIIAIIDLSSTSFCNRAGDDIYESSPLGIEILLSGDNLDCIKSSK